VQAFRVHTGLVAPLDRANVDTDAIIPKQFLKSIKRSGFGPNLFDEWRYLDRGEPGMDHAARPRNPDFVLNDPRYEGASILLARRNFGCGSSREHAPWALADFGFRAVISTSFADIFRNNSLKNGLLPVIVDAATHQRLLEQAADPAAEVTVDLDSQTVRLPDGSAATFPIDGFSKTCLLEGVDQLGYLLLHQTQVMTYEQTHPARVNTLALV
jgi:3-isopropylmalate/(R)-2-methylmalate dehydratase small subunit